MDALRVSAETSGRCELEDGEPVSAGMKVTPVSAKASGRCKPEDGEPVSAGMDATPVSAETGGRCELEDGEPLSSTAVRRLTCDASVVSVLERNGKPLSIGRKTRSIPPALQRALRMRDGCCAFPGCTQRYHLDSHHIEHWADGGQTKLDNLVRLCRHHHRLLHEGGFRVVRSARGLTFISPKGRVIPQAPRLPRGDCTSLVRSNEDRGLRPTGLTLFPPYSHGENFHLGWSVEALLETRARE